MVLIWLTRIYLVLYVIVHVELVRQVYPDLAPGFSFALNWISILIGLFALIAFCIVRFGSSQFWRVCFVAMIGMQVYLVGTSDWQDSSLGSILYFAIYCLITVCPPLLTCWSLGFYKMPKSKSGSDV